MADTPNGTSTAMAQEYVGESAPTGVRADAMLREASRIVADIAPPPSTVDSDYQQAASDAELRVFEILATEKHRIKSESVDSISVSYADSSSDIYALVRDAMAKWIPAHSGDDGPGTVSFATVEW